MLYQPVLYVLPKYSNKITFPEEVDQGSCVLFTEGTGSPLEKYLFYRGNFAWQFFCEGVSIGKLKG